MEEFLKDKIFQFYFQKTYGKKSNYLSFPTFSDKDKVSFLINLYLFISNIGNMNNNNLTNNIENEYNFHLNNENDVFYQDNYNKIMTEYTNILNKYNNEFHSKPLINDNTDKKEEKSLEENINNKSKINETNENIEKEKEFLYKKKNFNKNSINSLDTDNYFEEKNIKDENEIILNSQKNDIDINMENKNLLKSGKYNSIINNDSNNNKINTKNIKIKTENNELELSSRSYDKKNTNKISSNMINTEKKLNINENEKITSLKSVNITSKNSPKAKNSQIIVEDVILTDKTLTEKSLIHLEEFTNDNIVEKLIKCPQNKYISLNCSEANKIALVIINLMESKNDLESEIEEERKKNEIKFEKLKIDFEKQKNDIKALYNKKEINIIKVLGELDKDINEEKIFLDEEEKGYNLWDHITIENQRTKEIRESIMKKLESFKN